MPHHKGSFDVRGTVDDFDFLAGKWTVHCRRLLEPLSGSNEWIDFDGTNVSRPVWHGHANVDEFEADTPSGRIQGLTVRLFVRFLWTVNSADSCRWEQAFSRDDGETWETNWTWDLTRVKR